MRRPKTERPHGRRLYAWRQPMNRRNCAGRPLSSGSPARHRDCLHGDRARRTGCRRAPMRAKLGSGVRFAACLRQSACGRFASGDRAAVLLQGRSAAAVEQPRGGLPGKRLAATWRQARSSTLDMREASLEGTGVAVTFWSSTLEVRLSPRRSRTTFTGLGGPFFCPQALRLRKKSDCRAARGPGSREGCGLRIRAGTARGAAAPAPPCRRSRRGRPAATGT